ncbi:reverse transcriptase domain-containing protein [Tanacetum coccineum]
MIAPGPCRNSSKTVSKTSPNESVGSNVMIHNYYLEEAKKKEQLQKDQALNSKPSVLKITRLSKTANGSKPKPKNSYQQPRNWTPSMSSRISNKVVQKATTQPRHSKSFLNSKHLAYGSKIKSIDGTIKGKDGKPMKAFRNVSFEASKPDGVQSSKSQKDCDPISDKNEKDGCDSTTEQEPKQSFASKVKNQTNTHAVHIQKVSNDTVIPGAHVAIPIEAIDEHAWAKYGFETAMLHEGFFLFQFATKARMEQVLENGPWLIRLVPIVLNIWIPNTHLKKDDIKVAPVWVKLHKVPIMAFFKVGLSLKTSQIGRPIMLNVYTSSMCLKSWGRNTYVRALVKVSTDKGFVDSLVVAILYKNEEGHSLETVEVEYEWQPPRCDNCKIFNHKDEECPKLIKVTTPKPIDTNGFTQVTRKQNKGKHVTKPRNIYGIKLTKPKVNFVWEKKQPAKASSSTSQQGMNATKEATKSNISSTEVQGKNGMNDGINIMTLKNSFKSLIEADKVLDVQPNDMTQNPKYVVEDEDDDVEEVHVMEEYGRLHEELKLKRKNNSNSELPDTDVEPEPNLPLQEIIILDPDDQPMWESAKTVAPTPNSAIVQIDVDDNFVINSTHLKMIWENKFDGYLRADPHDHIREFLAICNMFKYGETQSEAVKLLIFPFSLCDEAKTWFNELNEESITSWEQMRRAFINRFFPPSLFNRLLLEIRNFSQLVCESLTEAWLRLKNMLRKCHGHGLTKGAIIQIFYHGLDEPTQGILDVTAGGIFLYKSPNQAFQFLDDKVLFKHDWPIKSKNEHHRKSISFADGCDSNTNSS